MLEKVLNDEDVVTIAIGKGGIDVRVNGLSDAPEPPQFYAQATVDVPWPGPAPWYSRLEIIPEHRESARQVERRKWRGRLRDIAATIFLAAVTSRGLIYIGQLMGWW